MSGLTQQAGVCGLNPRPPHSKAQALVAVLSCFLPSNESCSQGYRLPLQKQPLLLTLSPPQLTLHPLSHHSHPFPTGVPLHFCQRHPFLLPIEVLLKPWDLKVPILLESSSHTGSIRSTWKLVSNAWSEEGASWGKECCSGSPPHPPTPQEKCARKLSLLF